MLNFKGPDFNKLGDFGPWSQKFSLIYYSAQIKELVKHSKLNIHHVKWTSIALNFSIVNDVLIHEHLIILVFH